MRRLPSSMKKKLQEQFQTHYKNADPRIHLIMQRAKRYIGQDGFMTPVDIRKGDVGSIDVAIRREDHLTAPDKIFMIYIENNTAKVACTDYINAIENTEPWEYLYCLENPVVDVAIEFDGYWMRTSSEAEVCFDAPANWSHVTSEEPWFFMVLTNGKLIAQNGQNGDKITLASNGVTKVSAIRGWKNVVTPYSDHGLFVAYIRNGVVCYRNLAEQEDGNIIWEPERKVESLGTSVQNIATFRTNDYRVGILAEVNGEIKWILSERNWGGMGVPAEKIDVELSNLEIVLHELIYKDGFSIENLDTRIDNLECKLCPNIYPEPVEIWNFPEDTTSIFIEFDMEMTNFIGQESAFTLIDENNVNVKIHSTEQGDTIKQIKLNTDDFSSSKPPLKISYDSSKGTFGAIVPGGCLMKKDFEIEFTPIILIPKINTEEIINTEINLELCLHKLNHIDNNYEEYLDCEISSLTLELINIEDIEP